MDTKIIKIQDPEKEQAALAEAGAIVRSGGLVVFPTETVYGLGANGLAADAISAIYRAKGRPSDNPVILHVADKNGVKDIVKEVNSTAEKLMDTFWPGPLTIIFPRSALVPDRATGGLDTVAVRCPSDPIAHAFLKAAGVPVAAPSANISGRPSPTTAEDAAHDMMGKVDLILDGGNSAIGLESTVVEAADGKITILRPGGITKEMLEAVAKEVSYDAHLITGEGVPKAPGMKYRHYAPAAPMTVVVGQEQAVRRELQRLYDAYKKEGLSVGFLVSEELKAGLPEGPVYIWGSRSEQKDLAEHLYKGLLYFDTAGVDRILAEGTEEHGLGAAIMNRMGKASGHHILYV